MPRPYAVQGDPPDEPPRNPLEAIGEAFQRLADRQLDNQAVDQEAETEGDLYDQVSRRARADQRVSATAYRVLATLEGYCWGISRVCFVTNRIIGLNSGGISPETVRRALRCLEKAGYLRIEEDKTRMRGQRIVMLFELRKPERFDLD